jgi:hypothetical protein
MKNEFPPLSPDGYPATCSAISFDNGTDLVSNAAKGTEVKNHGVSKGLAAVAILPYNPTTADINDNIMRAKIEALGRIKKEFPPRGNFQLFQLDKPVTFFCTFRKMEVTAAKVALDLRTGDLLSNGAYGQLVAGS